MAGERKYVEFRTICAHSAFGPRFSSEEYTLHGNVACLRTMDIDSNGRINFPAMPIAKLDLTRLTNHILQRDDIVITRTGAYLGKVAVFTEFRLPVLAGAFSIYFRLKRDVADPVFVRYFFNSSEGQRAIRSIATGSAQPNLNIPNLHSLKVPLPPLTEQKTIAAVLGALDDKIELNRRMNATLESMARALFQSWFVDFDPVRAKLDGRKPVGMDEETAALFPNSFQDSELGQIPKGWSVGRVAEIADFSRSSLNPNEFSQETFDHYSLPAFDGGRTPKSEPGSAIMSSKLVVTPNSVLLSKLNPHIPRVWLPDLHQSRRSVCSTEFIVASARSGYSREFLFSLFTSEAFASTYGTLVTGTTGSHQRIRPESVLEMKNVIPPKKLVEAFKNHTKPIFDLTSRNIDQSSTLATLRETLLPKLLSGELSVAGLHHEVPV